MKAPGVRRREVIACVVSRDAVRAQGGRTCGVLRRITCSTGAACLFWAALALSLGPVGACSSSAQKEATPSAALSSSQTAQEAFRTIRQRWNAAASDAERDRLEPLLTWFLTAFPRDGQAPVARTLAAIVALDRGDAARARSLVAPVLDGPPGAARDLATVVDATLLDRSGQPAVALERLEPLVGKLIDPAARGRFDEELVHAALGARHWYEAVAYMDVWLRDTSEEDLERVRRRIDEALAKIPTEALELMFQTMTSAGSRAGYGEAVQRAVEARLAAVALRDRDAKLARRLLDEGRGFPAATNSEGNDGLADLASIGGASRVDGRTVGLLVSVLTDTDRTRSGEALSGVMDGLGLFENPSGRSGDAVRLVTRQEKDRRNIDTAVASLAAQGASILVIAFAPEQAEAALRAADRLGVAAIALTVADGPSSPNAFFVGEDEQHVSDLLVEALAARGARHIAPVGSQAAPRAQSPLPQAPPPHQVPLQPQAAPPPQAPPNAHARAPQPDPQVLAANVSCDAPAAQAGEPRFSTETWRDERIDALLLLGDPSCSRDAVDAAWAAKLRVRAALGLDSAELAWDLDRVPLLAVRAGAFPLLKRDHGSPLAAFAAQHGAPPSWLAAVGRDAAVLARAALRSLPATATEDAAEVMRRRSAVRTALEKTNGLSLWSTQAGGFDGKHRLSRTLSVVRSP